MNFESRLDKDLQSTTAQMIDHMKSHSLLSKENVDLMLPLESAMKESFEKTKNQ